MSKTTAFLFPGQGSQFVGMGSSLIESSPKARRLVEEADEILGFSLGRLICEGPDDELQLTANTQPAILLVSVIALQALRDSCDIEPVAVAGHSLGEFSACFCAGSLAFSDAIRLVRKRGELMQSAAPVGVGAMGAIIGLDADSVIQICHEAGGEVAPANFNSPEQTVIAGKTEDVRNAMSIAKSRGAKKVVELQVSAPFHTMMMKPARDGLAEFMESIKFLNPAIPVVRNVDAGLSRTAEDVSNGLIRQVTGCVRWVESMRRLKQMGVSRVIEIGPGKVLGGLMKRIDRSIDVARVGSVEDIAKMRGETNGQA